MLYQKVLICNFVTYSALQKKNHNFFDTNYFLCILLGFHVIHIHSIVDNCETEREGSLVFQNVLY